MARKEGGMNIAFIGAGAMARAISAGASTANPQEWSFTFYDPAPGAADQAAKGCGGTAMPTAESAMEGADLVVLAVKPQVQAAVIAGLPKTDACIVSIAAGRTTADITADLLAAGWVSPAVVRVMPNVNAMVGRATSAICWNDVASRAQVSAVTSLFGAIGETMEIPEPLFGAFTAMAGSSPAWFFRIVNALALAGVAAGLTKQQASLAAASAMAGSGELLVRTLHDGGHPETLVDQVCSPGGTTIAGLLAAEDAGLSAALDAAVDATILRDSELG